MFPVAIDIKCLIQICAVRDLATPNEAQQNTIRTNNSFAKAVVKGVGEIQESGPIMSLVKCVAVAILESGEP